MPEPTTGQISIHTDNILPIIKKWLYSEHDIFLRELIANAYDAINKRKKVATFEGRSVDPGKIDISFSESDNTITISDNGIGMTADEVNQYINQIAFSGASDFVKKFEGKTDTSDIIGHFGLGFYSAFMVADVVEIQTLSDQVDASPVRWTCDGSSQFSLDAGTRKDVGTDIILTINGESKEFVSNERLTHLVKKYANFLPVPISINGTIVNDQSPLWVMPPAEVSDDDYKAFYQKLHPYSPEPLFWIHLNVDFPFNLKGILYFPKILHELDSHKGKIHLFCQQVFVTDDAKGVVPEFLTLLQGAIDCSNIPLNVSRSYLQQDPNVQKIAKHIVKKVADRLTDLAKKDGNQFERFWTDIHPFVKYGMMTNDEFYDRLKDTIIFQSSKGYHTTITDYLDRNKDIMEKTVLYCADKDGQATYVALCEDQGMEVIFLTGLIDHHFIQFLESKNSDVKFQSVDAAVSDNWVDKAKAATIVDPTDNKTADQKLESVFSNVLKSNKIVIQVSHLKSQDVPAICIEAEQTKRLKMMTMMMKGGAIPDSLSNQTLVVNASHPLVQRIQKLSDQIGGQDKVVDLVQTVFDFAKMSQSPMSGDEMVKFVRRTSELLAKID